MIAISGKANRNATIDLRLATLRAPTRRVVRMPISRATASAISPTLHSMSGGRHGGPSALLRGWDATYFREHCTHFSAAMRNCLRLFGSRCFSCLFSSHWAENTCIIASDAAPSFEFLGIAAQRVRLRQVPDHALVFGVVYHRQALLRRFAKARERDAQIVPRQQEGRLAAHQCTDCALSSGRLGAAYLGGIDDAAQPALPIDDENLLRAAGGKPARQLAR